MLDTERVKKNAMDLSLKMVNNATDKDGNIDMPLLMAGVSLALDNIFNVISKGDKAEYDQLWNIMIGSINVVKD